MSPIIESDGQEQPCMGVVLPFERRPKGLTTDRRGAAHTLDSAVELGLTQAVRDGCDRRGILAAARPLLDRCRDRYGFVVMRDGLPKEPAILRRSLMELSRGLSMLDAEMGSPRTYPTFGVYFGRRQLAWFEDGYSGTTALAVPSETEAADLAEFVRPRIAVAR